jgi:hypothetical protein
MQTKFDPGSLQSQTLVLPFQRLSGGAGTHNASVGLSARTATLRETSLQVLPAQRVEDLAWIALALTSLAALVLSLLV